MDKNSTPVILANGERVVIFEYATAQCPFRAGAEKSYCVGGLCPFSHGIPGVREHPEELWGFCTLAESSKSLGGLGSGLAVLARTLERGIKEQLPRILDMAEGVASSPAAKMLGFRSKKPKGRN